MKSEEFLRRLRSLGVEVLPAKRGKGSHKLIAYQGKTTTLPFHKGKDMDPQFCKLICKQLGLDFKQL